MKKIDFKKLLVMFLISSMLLGALAACTQGDVSTDTDTNAPTETETEVPETYFELVKSGELVPVVYGVYATGTEISLARSIIDGINRFVPVKGRPESEGTYDPNKVEILVGNTTYPESQQLLNEIGYGEGAIKVIGNKLVVVGSDTAALEKAIIKLIDECYNSKDENKNIFIKSSFTASAVSNELVAALPVHPKAAPQKVVDTTSECYLMDFGENKETIFREYLTLLEEDGFTLYAENNLEGNEYYTYVNDELVVNVIFTKYNRKFKITVEKLATTELPARAEDNVYTPVAGLKSMITQVGLFYNVKTDEHGAMTNFNGMCYVIRLADGSFIVVDGGHGDATQVDNLYKTMETQAPDPENIVIAAWFFSHDHGDHTGTFQPFVNKYKDKVTVERFIYNFPGEEQGNGTVYKTMRSYIKGFFPDAKMVKAHPGQVFHLRNAKITMLYTMDVYESEELTDTNNASIVWKMEMEGKTFMCLGDYSESSLHLQKLYTKETLKSDIVQIAHHGISGQDGSIYPIIEPEYAFWPVGAYHVIFHSNGNIPDLELDKKGFNSYFMNTMDQNKVFLAEDNFVVMTIDNGNISTQVFDNNEDFFANFKN